jgi:hypothetical protein
MTDKHMLARKAYDKRIDLFFEKYALIEPDFDEFERFNEEQIVNTFAIDLNEETEIKDAGHGW